MFRALTFVGCAVASISATSLNAADSDTGAQFDRSDVDRIEEDWVVYVRNPDKETGAPQIAHVISPLQSTDRIFGMVEINHQSQPRFQVGGIQVQTWLDDDYADLAYSDQNSPLNADFEKLTYTVGMQQNDGAISVFVQNGQSRSWGEFAQTPIAAKTPKTDLDLSDYSPEFSVANTTVNHGAHRVVLMYLRRVRYFSDDKLKFTDSKPQVLHRFRRVVEFVSLEEYEKKLQEFNIEITEQ